jgi:hypothetical protein
MKSQAGAFFFFEGQNDIAHIYIEYANFAIETSCDHY